MNIRLSQVAVTYHHEQLAHLDDQIECTLNRLWFWLARLVAKANQKPGTPEVGAWGWIRGEFAHRLEAPQSYYKFCMDNHLLRLQVPPLAPEANK